MENCEVNQVCECNCNEVPKTNWEQEYKILQSEYRELRRLYERDVDKMRLLREILGEAENEKRDAWRQVEWYSSRCDVYRSAMADIGNVVRDENLRGQAIRKGVIDILNRI